MSERPLVLVIDDLPENVEVIGACLSDDCDVQCAFSGTEALELISASRPDLILLDVMMPGMDGYAVCEALKSDPRTADVPIIFVTARNDSASETRALMVGGVDFIQKPVNREIVRARVALHLALRRRERELRDVNDALRQLTAELEQRVAERTQGLRDALVRVEAAHRAKSLFLANVSHELRTPMNGILGLSALLKTQVEDSRLSERLGKIESSGRRLLGVIADIIDVARLQAGRVEIDAADFMLGSVFDAVEGLWRQPAENKGLVLSRQIDPALPSMLHGDPVRIGHVLNNLLGNAVKFSDRGSIGVRADLVATTADEFNVRFQVADEGVGVPEDRLKTIFEVFEQADNSSTRGFAGVGLGLAICRHLVQLMNGRIGVSSVPGRGSVFWFEVPLSERRASSVESPELPKSEPQRERSAAIDLVNSVSRLIAARDFRAFTLWIENRSALALALAEYAPAFDAAMEKFDLDEALDRLSAARAALFSDQSSHAGVARESLDS